MQSKKGISLIVLVITIIIMIILAGTIILSISNTKILKNADKAVLDTDLATVKELAQVGWSEAYVKGAREVQDLKAGVLSILEKNDVKVEDYLIHVTTNGVTIKLVKESWIQEGFTVVKGDQVLEIGDTIYYDETKGNTFKVDNDVTWQVLGADEEGNLLIVSQGNVKESHTLGYDTTVTTDEEKLEECKKDYVNGVAELNSICESYGYGKGTVGIARSIEADDIEKITGFDKTTYQKGDVREYGNVVTYSWDGKEKIKYVGTKNTASASSVYNHDNFLWYDETTKTFPEVAKGETTIPLPTVTNTYYSYKPTELKTTNSKAYSVVFAIYDSYAYWVATPSVYTGPNCIGFGIKLINYGAVTNHILFYSYRAPNATSKGVRAVVTLSSDINFTGSSKAGWSY